MFSLKYKVRRGRPADAPVALKIFLSALREHGFLTIAGSVDNAELTSFGVREPTRDDFVAVSGGKVVGFVTLVQDCDRTAELTKVFVAPSHRDRGVGTMLITRAVETAQARGYEGLHLETSDVFAVARRYYERHGWKRSPGDERVEGRTTTTYRLSLLGARRAAPVPLELPGFLVWILSLLGSALRLKKRLDARAGRT